VSATTITDIWFRSPRSLEEIAAALGLSGVEVDGEDTWDWVIGDLLGVRLDVTRNHRKPAGQTETRIFRLDRAPFTPVERAEIAARLRQALDVQTTCGRWVYRSGNDFDLEVAAEEP
jgi:hypothetical protein